MRENPAGEAKNGGMRLVFDRPLGPEFRGAKTTSDAGLLAVRELDEMMGLTDMAGDSIAGGRSGKNIRHQIYLDCSGNLSALVSPVTRMSTTRSLFHETLR